MSLAPGLARTTSSRLLTRANEPELKSQSESAYRVVKQRKVGAPDTIRTCDLCLRRANANQPCCPPPTEIVGLASIGMSRDGFHETIGGDALVFGRSSNGGFWSW